MRRTFSFAYSLASALFLLTQPCFAQNAGEEASGDTFAGICENGAQVVEEKYCRFFQYYNNNSDEAIDLRIADALKIEKHSQTRSIGFIIAIDKYPNLPQAPDADVSAAAVDADRLYHFLVDDQKFDEVIVLRNDDASVDNINYFLKGYLPQRARDFGTRDDPKGRLVIAYTGHGRFGNADLSMTGQDSAFILSAARRMDDTAGVYDMETFAKNVKGLSNSYFHVLTLINACFGGNVFGLGYTGGNADDISSRGSYVITAGRADDVVPSLDPSRGSLFFDLIIGGVTSGDADPWYGKIYKVSNVDGTIVATSGLTRTSLLSSFLTTKYRDEVLARKSTNRSFKLSKPWIGPAQIGTAEGGFFFLHNEASQSPRAAALTVGLNTILPYQETPIRPSVALLQNASFQRNEDAQILRAIELTAVTPPAKSAPLIVPPGPISSLPGRPDIKIFKPHEIYPVQGLDISSVDGTGITGINWTAFSKTKLPRFVYVRALSWNGRDRKYHNSVEHLKALQIDHGAYLKYDFCSTPAEQIVVFKDIVGDDPDLLPVAIYLIDPLGENNKKQESCLAKIGKERAKSDILELADSISEHFGKTPLLFGNYTNLETFTDQRSERFMVWLGSYGASGTRLKGGNPWTIWQYSGTVDVPGLGKQSTGDVFFGTEAQYAEFKSGRTNTARTAVSR